ncbi:malto-oligosyltrehalose synthase [Ancylobacter sp. 6x-1]|uniref:Malto-oligosyltrehalose synthase n=1 Tax=Ancylobacter crimeensis TaxID=2579147 RepID=A0ABT0D783_9HYPH|nr:malto-oligosyltrehalose synthase [Ancylobacter crimeensis]MCK0195804.1 malto-oligosyltrehalose synthase [Ancylobacter crimeensis]
MTTTTGRPLLSTYRLQFHKDFPFPAAQALAPHLRELGISHAYCSPVFAAVPGSTHGYDVTDPAMINPELGGEAGFRAMAEAFAAEGIGLILDIVPNHMAASDHNPYWMEALEFGPDGPAARLFDIDWGAGKLLLPVLGDSLADTMEAGQITLEPDWAVGRINAAAYGEKTFPLAPASVAALLATAAEHSEDGAALSYAADLWSMLASGPVDPDDIARARAALSALPEADRETLEAELARADVAEILSTQHWRLAWWRIASDELNYRRFFNINDLVGVRVEDPHVFELVHRLPLLLVREGVVDGLRVDHIDGLVDPEAYTRRLRAAVGGHAPIFVEKILEHGEVLPPWPIDGTTGYERLNDINGLFVDEDGYRALETHLREANLLAGTVEARIVTAKKDVLERSFLNEIKALTELAHTALAEQMEAADMSPAALRRGLIALIAHFPVYRSYATEAGHSDADAELWNRARAAIEAAEDPLTAKAAALLLDHLADPRDADDHRFRTRFQQLSGPAMAKGFEDTELYRNMTLLSVNEVGGDLLRPGRSRDELHALLRQRAESGARDLTPLATHDTKRGPSTRARLNALTLDPDAFLDFLATIEEFTRPRRRSEEGRPMPDDLDAWLVHQTLLAAWPITPERMEQYLTKALREAKRHSNWETPDETYEAATLGFARSLIAAPETEPYRAALGRLVERFDEAGHIFGVAQSLVQLTMPGTPDIYQGTEFRDFSLVDPDNRRPVDYVARKAVLDGKVDGIDPRDAELGTLTRQLLTARRTCPALTGGAYRALGFAPSPWRWFGFMREADGSAALLIVPTRVPIGSEAPPSITLADDLGGGWRNLDGNRAEPRMLADPSRPWQVLLRG